ncbi:hypothetical protein ASD64_17805 [Mesorhizobium sp. Root157]|nr:hypothetical protein ASD64_17805 [Mesorhizobium sp. Root157]
MGKRSDKYHARREEEVLLDLLDRMEPDLRLLEGSVSVLRALSEASDAVEPVAMEAMAHLAGESLERVALRWREACGVLRKR